MSGIDRSALQLAAVAGLPVLSVTHGIDRLRGLWQALYPAAGRCFVLFEPLQAEAYRQGLSIHGGQIIGRGRPRGGLSEEARQLGVSRQVLYRARKMAGLSPEAKDEAIRRGLTTATTTLLRAQQNRATRLEQVRVIQEEYIRRVRTPGSHLVPRLKAGHMTRIVTTSYRYRRPVKKRKAVAIAGGTGPHAAKLKIERMFREGTERPGRGCDATAAATSAPSRAAAVGPETADAPRRRRRLRHPVLNRYRRSAGPALGANASASGWVWGHTGR